MYSFRCIQVNIFLPSFTRAFDMHYRISPDAKAGALEPRKAGHPEIGRAIWHQRQWRGLATLSRYRGAVDRRGGRLLRSLLRDVPARQRNASRSDDTEIFRQSERQRLVERVGILVKAESRAQVEGEVPGRGCAERQVSIVERCPCPYNRCDLCEGKREEERAANHRRGVRCRACGARVPASRRVLGRQPPAGLHSDLRVELDIDDGSRPRWTRDLRPHHWSVYRKRCTLYMIVSYMWCELTNNIVPFAGWLIALLPLPSLTCETLAFVALHLHVGNNAFVQC
jgi:hypothetical protein